MTESTESKDTLFFSSKVKIERAKQHVREYNEELGEYIKTKPYRIVVEKDPDSDNNLWTLREKNEVPDELSAIIIDVVRNLRVSLDLLVSEMLSMAEGKLNKVCFPFAKNAGDLEKMIKKQHIDRAGDNIVEVLKALKPYKGGNELLLAVHDLDISDKEKGLAPSVHYTGIKNFKRSRSGDPMIEVDNKHCGPIHDGTVIISLPPMSTARPGKVFEPSLRVTFDEYPALKGKDVAESLNKIISLTEEIIGLFAKRLGAEGARDFPASK